LKDVVFEACVLVEPDFGGASLERVAFVDCVVKGADFNKVTLKDVDLRQAAELGVAASMQPPHTAYTRADHSDAWSRRLGPERAGRAWRIRELREAGGTG
ncbi:hypothetical protein ADL27_53940, partial [Streptomyces sp. NRRL F-6602]